MFPEFSSLFPKHKEGIVIAGRIPPEHVALCLAPGAPPNLCSAHDPTPLARLDHYPREPDWQCRKKVKL